MLFGSKLKRCREEKGLTQEDVAAFLVKILADNLCLNGNGTRHFQR